MVPVTVSERNRYHQDDIGQNARSIIEALRREAEIIEAQAEAKAGAAIAKEAERHTRRWTATVASQAQIDIRYLLRDDDLVDLLSVRSEEFNRLIRSLSQDIRDRIERETLGAIFEGRGNAEIAKSLQEIDGIGRNRARLIARDQASKLNGAMNEFRQRQAGISHFKWKTILDGRERPEHHARNGKIYSWDKPPNGEKPGQPINCRCRGLAVITDDPDALAELDQPDDLGDWFEDNLPLVRAVAPTPSQPVFGLAQEVVTQRLAMTRELSTSVSAAKVSSEFTEAMAERLSVEMYGFKLSDDDLDGLIGNRLRALVPKRRTKLIEAVKARLELIENLLRNAAINHGATD